MKTQLLTALIVPVFFTTNLEASEAKMIKTEVLSSGETISFIELKNANRVTARVMTLGATWQAMLVPDKNGRMADVILGYDTAKEYVARSQFFGITVGRYANRIKEGKFTLDGKNYQLPINNPPNSLHGGHNGFGTKNWEIHEINKGGRGQEASVTFKYISKDGEEGYPGTVTTYVTYSLNENNDLSVKYSATTDAPTIINLTNHALFNMSGVVSGRGALDAKLTLFADSYLPTDVNAIPTGEIRPVAGSVFDFRRAKVIGNYVRDASDEQIMIGLGFDHNFNINGGVTARPKRAASLVDELSGRGMNISTTEPGIQFYSGNFLDGKTPGKGNKVYRMGDGVALEAQKWPDSPNRPEFPSTRLNPGQTYTQTTIHHFFTKK